MISKCICFVTLYLPLSFGANILGIMPTPSYSHQIAFTRLWKELSLRGHNVTVITPNPQKNDALKNLTEIDVSFSYEFFKNISDKAENEMTMWNVYEKFQEMALKISRSQLASPAVQNLMDDRNKKFDLVMVELLFPEFLAFAEIYHCPRIVISSFQGCEVFHNLLGNPVHPVLYPHLTAPYYTVQSFVDRVISTVHSWYMWHYHTYRYFPEREEILHEFFGKSLSLRELINRVDMMFLNRNSAIQTPRPLGPQTIEIGGQRKVGRDQTLPEDLKIFLDGAKNGFIYFSLGSNVKSKELGKQTLDAIVAALSEIPYKVLWKFEADILPGRPSNVKLVKWAPQQQILVHQNIKLFVTQGGLQSMEEGIYGEVPFVVIPFFGDQHQNANLMRAKGIARIVGRKPFIKKDDLKGAILEVIQNPSYKAAVQNLKRLALDTPMTGLEKAVWWTEYVIRNNGTKHLRNPAADLPSYQYYLLDVISFLILVVTLAAWAIIVVLKLTCRLLRKCMYKSKLKEQ